MIDDKNRRQKNLALLAVLAGLVILLFIITIIRFNKTPGAL